MRTPAASTVTLMTGAGACSSGCDGEAVVSTVGCPAFFAACVVEADVPGLTCEPEAWRRGGEVAKFVRAGVV